MNTDETPAPPEMSTAEAYEYFLANPQEKLIIKPGLSGPQQKFAEGIVVGLTQQAAYMAAYTDSSEDSALVSASRLLRNDNVQNEISRLRKLAVEAAGGTIMTLAQTLQFLSAVIMTPVGQLAEDNPLTQDYTEDESMLGPRKKIKACDKLKALELLSRLTGRFQDTLKLDADKVVRVVIGE